MHSLSYSLSFRGKLYSLHSPAGANLQPIHSPDISHLEPAPVSVRSDTLGQEKLYPQEVHPSPSFSKVFPRLSSTCPHPNHQLWSGIVSQPTVSQFEGNHWPPWEWIHTESPAASQRLEVKEGLGYTAHVAYLCSDTCIVSGVHVLSHCSCTSLSFIFSSMVSIELYHMQQQW